jgi:hypothetical protein
MGFLNLGQARRQGALALVGSVQRTLQGLNVYLGGRLTLSHALPHRLVGTGAGREG